MKTLFIDLLGISLLLSSLLSITTTNPVISVIFLISTFVCSAGYLILLGVSFLGISYIVIYVGAIAVLFLFVIMMININITDIVDTGKHYTKNFPLSIIIISFFIYLLNRLLEIKLFEHKPFILDIQSYNILPYQVFEQRLDYLDKIFNPFQQIETLGHSLYTYGAILFIILSIILLLAMFATIILSLKEKNI